MSSKSSKSFQFKDFLCGGFGGLCGIALSHPFDTIKVIYQEGNYKNLFDCTKNIYQESGLKGFYRGIAPPLIGVTVEKCFLFGSYDNFKNNNPLCNDNNRNSYTNIFASGVFSGLITTFVVTPVDKVKILLQNKKQISLKNIIQNGNIMSLYNGWSATLFREVPGYGIYFTSYEYLKNTFGMPYFYTPIIYGSLCGIASWLFIYPSDPIKTKMQNNSINFKNALKIILQNEGVYGLYRGMSLALFRAIPLHGGVFMGYELCKTQF
jgi:solute carrier family 25 carnitine/acylcarnitine transporter 20/29